MPTADDPHSVTVWIQALKEGDPNAAETIWRRYFERLVRLAGARLKGTPRALADEEDAALNAFDSFFRGVENQRYPRLDDRHDLWRLLVVIAERKALDQRQHERRQKRGGGKKVGTIDPTSADKEEGRSLAVADSQPTPEFAATVADEYARLFRLLRDDTLREVARLRMECFTNEEIARQMGCSLRTVARKVELIQRTWREEIEE